MGPDRRISSVGCATLLLLAVLASGGCGDDDASGDADVVPAGTVAVIARAPGDARLVTKTEHRSAVGQLAKARGVSPQRAQNLAPLRAAALALLIEVSWLEGEGSARGISLSSKAGVANLARRASLLRKALQADVEDEFPKPSHAEVVEYYDEHVDGKYTDEATRDLRVLVNKDAAVLERSKAALAKDDSPAQWIRLARLYSEDPSNNKLGGLVQALRKGEAEPAMDEAIFSASVGSIEGIVDGAKGRKYVFEVTKAKRGGARPLPEIERQVRSDLEAELRETNARSFIARYKVRWKARTTCDPAHLVPLCANYEAGSE